KKNISNQSGFTLIEMLTSMSILLILTFMVVANYNTAGKKGELNIAAQQLASDIRRVQAHALGLKEFDFGSGLENPPGGWGIYFRDQGPNRYGYYFFADDGDHRRHNNGSEDFGGEILFPGEIAIVAHHGLFIDGSEENPIFISFQPPDPIVWICDNQGASCTSGDSAKIILTNDSGNKIIYINKFGLVDILN
ncbi:MAG: type II secretion system protein, partial [Patescibacteria group bacterium]|nr:type II secretion system protein [Patescibacteria group bacterium]